MEEWARNTETYFRESIKGCRYDGTAVQGPWTSRKNMEPAEVQSNAFHSDADSLHPIMIN